MSEKQSPALNAAPREVPKLDKSLGIKSYRSAGTGRDGEMFTCQLTLDGKTIAHVTQEGHGGGNIYDFTDRRLEKELQTWAATLTGSEYGGLDLIVEHLIELAELNRQARKWARQGHAAAVLILAEPQFLDEGEEPNPYSTYFRKIIFRPVRDRKYAEELATAEGAHFYAVSNPLPEGAVADPDAVEKEDLLKQARKWNKHDPTIRAAILIKETLTSEGTMYALRSDADIERLVKKHGAALYQVSEFLPEPTAEQVRQVEIGRLNKQLEAFRKTNGRIVAALLIETAQGKRILGVPSRNPEVIKFHLKQSGATSDDYLISDPLPGGNTTNRPATSATRAKKTLI
jgi:hypothetical protein